jgi:hypothetical protein
MQNEWNRRLNKDVTNLNDRKNRSEFHGTRKRPVAMTENPGIAVIGSTILVLTGAASAGSVSHGVDAGSGFQDEPAAVVRLQPQVRTAPSEGTVSVIPLEAIRSFLTQPRVLEVAAVEGLPAIVGFPDEHISGGAGYSIYVRGLSAAPGNLFSVFRVGSEYRDGATGEVLGYEALHVGDAQVMAPGDPAKLVLIRAEREALIGDRLLPMESADEATALHLRSPGKPVSGRIIRVLDGVTQIGQYQVVVVDRGRRDGLEPGHVLQVYREGRLDQPGIGVSEERLRIPPEWLGSMVIFRVFERVSYGLVTKATRSMHVLDAARSP